MRVSVRVDALSVKEAAAVELRGSEMDCETANASDSATGVTGSAEVSAPFEDIFRRER